MRKLIYALIALSLFTQYSCGPTQVVVQSPQPPPPPPAELSYQSFYDALSPYGQWIDNPQYGYVWMPNVGPDFKPYSTNGNWVYTDGGWTWASNYPWGWATFHYGRWFFEEGYGWTWIPGNEWAPAWVSWRQSPEYYGWAPLGPNVSISVSANGGYNPPAHYWCFVPQQYVTSPRVNNYYVNEQQNVTIINNTTIVNNRNSDTRVNVNNYAGGPDPVAVSRVTGTPLRPVVLRESNTPGENLTGSGLTMYRPRVSAASQSNGSSAVRPAPVHAQTLSAVRPVNPTIYNRGTFNTTNTTNNTNTSTTNNTNITNTTTNNSNIRNNEQPARTEFGRPNTAAPPNNGMSHMQQNSSAPPASQPTLLRPPVVQQAAPKPAVTQPTSAGTSLNPPSRQGFNHLPASNNAVGASQPDQPAKSQNAFKPSAPKGQNPAPPRRKTDSTRHQQN